MKKFAWAVIGVAIVLMLFIAAGKSMKRKTSTDALWMRDETARIDSTLTEALPGRRMACVGGKLDPICVGSYIGLVYAKYGTFTSHVTLVPGRVPGSAASGITGWYIGGKACRFYYVTEESAQCFDDSGKKTFAKCGIIKEIACE